MAALQTNEITEIIRTMHSSLDHVMNYLLRLDEGEKYAARTQASAAVGEISQLMKANGVGAEEFSLTLAFAKNDSRYSGDNPDLNVAKSVTISFGPDGSGAAYSNWMAGLHAYNGHLVQALKEDMGPEEINAFNAKWLEREELREVHTIIAKYRDDFLSELRGGRDPFEDIDLSKENERLLKLFEEEAPNERILNPAGIIEANNALLETFSGRDETARMTNEEIDRFYVALTPAIVSNTTFDLVADQDKLDRANQRLTGSVDNVREVSDMTAFNGDDGQTVGEALGGKDVVISIKGPGLK